MFITLLRWMSRWPLRRLHALGAWAGWLVFWLSASYRRRLRAHVAQAGLPPEVVGEAARSAGRMLCEIPRLWLRPREESVAGWARWDGVEQVQAALDAGRGLVVLTPHLGCFEMVAQLYAETFGARAPMTALYRPARQPWLRELVAASRDRPGLQAAPATLAGVRQMLRALKKGECVGVLPDQVPPDGLGLWAPFFGRTAYSMTLAARLLQQTGAAPLLLWGERLPRGEGYVVHVRPWREAPTDDLQAGTEAVNRAMESLIRECPGQYLWGYNRYKAPRALDLGEGS